jgi:hypothetical protein
LPKEGSARRPRSSTLAALSAGLDETFHVWANVDYEKYEFDWLVFCERGWFGIYEEKTFDRPVAETAEWGEPWILVGGETVDNPGEQVRKHADVFQGFVRRDIIPRFVPQTSERVVRHLKIWCGVYSPHITDETRLVQPRWGRFYRNLEAFVRGIAVLEPNEVLALDTDTAWAVVDRLNKTLHAHPAESGDIPSTTSEDEAHVDESAATTSEPLIQRIEALERRVTALEQRLTSLT